MSMVPRSIRWRLQVWHGTLLLVVLAAFGFTAFLLVRESRLRRVDQELLRRAAAVADAVRPPGHRDGPRDPLREGPRSGLREGPWADGLRDGARNPARSGRAAGPLLPNSPPGTQFGPGNLPDLHLTTDLTRLFQAGDGPDAGYYFVVFAPHAAVLARSPHAPAGVPPPAGAFFEETFRNRGDLRERQSRPRSGLGIVVGRSIAPDLAELRRLALWLGACAAGVLALGLAGGWWVATRAIRPIDAISATAQKIAAGNLAERIAAGDTDSELGRLAQVLNTTFDRLGEAFARQAQFTADASHELRTPVAVILAQTEAILARERPPGEYREALEACRRAARRLKHLTESLLTLARLDSGEPPGRPETVALDRVAAEAVDLLRPLATERSVRLDAELAEAPCAGHADRLAQVAANLVANAIHYNRPGGEVSVRTAIEDGAAVLSVRDTGTGIAPADVPHIFERFYRADASRARAEGRGLGLAIAKAIVESHGGTLGVESRPGEGSLFTVRIPALSADDPPRYSATPSPGG